MNDAFWIGTTPARPVDRPSYVPGWRSYTAEERPRGHETSYGNRLLPPYRKGDTVCRILRVRLSLAHLSSFDTLPAPVPLLVTKTFIGTTAGDSSFGYLSGGVIWKLKAGLS